MVNLTTSVSLKVACVAAMMETQSRFSAQYCGRSDDVLRVFVKDLVDPQTGYDAVSMM